jgi:hypothetical protein
MPTSPNLAPNFQFTDYAQQLQNIERRRQLAQALFQQGMEPVQGQPPVGGITVPNSPWAALGQVAKAGLGAYGLSQAEKKTEAVSKQRQLDLANSLRAMGVPETKIPSSLQLLNMPETAQLGQSQIQLQMLKNATGQGMSPMDPSNPNASVMAGQGTAPPQPSNAFSGLPPLDVLGTGEMGKAVWEKAAEQQKPFAGRPGAPVWQMVNGRLQMVGFAPKLDEGMVTNQSGNVSVAPGYAESKTGVGSIPNPSAPMVPMQTSTGQNIQLFQPESLEFQRTGQLPSRMRGGLPSYYSGRPNPGGVIGSPSIPTPFNPASPQGRPGLGVPGVGQSQEEQITQERQRAAGKAADEAFAKDYVAFKTGGAQDATKQLAQLDDVVKRLQSGKGYLTGPIIGRIPDVVTNFTNPKVVATRERVEEVVQRSLRAILGAQFTEREGERLIARAYNPSQPEAENAIRVERLMTQLQSALQNKASAAAHFERFGTLQGWSGKLPSISDFDVESRTSGGPISVDDLVKKYANPR